MLRQTVRFLCLCILVVITLLSIGCGSQSDTQGNQKNKTGLAYKTVAEADGQAMGVESGSILDMYTEKYMPNSPYQYYNSYSDSLVAMKAGKIEGFLCDEPVARKICQTNPGVGYIKEAVVADSLGIGINKTKPELKAILDAGIQRYKADGTLQQIDDIWFGDDESIKKMPEQKEGPKGTIICAVATAHDPMLYVSNGQVVGYEADLIMRIFQEAGYSVEFNNMDFQGLLPAVSSGKADLLAGTVSITEERKKSVLFSEPEYGGGIVLVVKDYSTLAADKGIWAGIEDSIHKNFIVEDRYKMVLDGLKTTIIITVGAAILGTILGFGVCMLRRSRRKIFQVPAKIFVKIMQGTPLVVFLMIMYYLVFSNVNIDPVYVAILAFAVNMGAYVSEMMRSGIDAVDKGQREAACAMGFTKLQTFIKIVAPQALKYIIPVYTGELISMMKMTSVVGYIAIQDLTKMSDIIRSRTYEAFFPLIVTALIYLVVAWILIAALSYLERKIDPKKRPRSLKGVTL